MELNPESKRATPRAPSATSLSPEPSLDLLAGLSRQLSRPLIALKEEVEAFSSSRSLPDGSARELAESCAKLLNLTREFFDYASFSHRPAALDLTTFTVSSWLIDVDRRYATLAEIRGLRWHSSSPTFDFQVSTDRAQLDQLVSHLFNNALKYCRAEGSIQTTIVREDSEFWRIEIADDGPGIPSADLETVFEPFSRFANPGSAEQEGNGLGLAFCRAATASLGGEIRLESTIGQGTRAIVRLPIDARHD